MKIGPLIDLTLCIAVRVHEHAQHLFLGAEHDDAAVVRGNLQFALPRLFRRGNVDFHVRLHRFLLQSIVQHGLALGVILSEGHCGRERKDANK